MNATLTFKPVEHRRTPKRHSNWFVRAVKALGEMISEARRMDRAYRELAAMSDPELEDMGIRRSDIPAVLAGRLHRERTAAASNVLPIARREKPRQPGVAISVRGRRSNQMCSPAEDEDSVDNVIDVRSLAPAQRHAKIFQLVDELGPGTSFILVNDHDPKPLFYQLEAEYPKQFSWTYLERGPEAWRVEIGKLAQAA